MSGVDIHLLLTHILGIVFGLLLLIYEVGTFLFRMSLCE